MDTGRLIPKEEINEAMKTEMPQSAAFRIVINSMIPEVMTSVDNSKDGMVLGHQIASILLAASVETLLATIYAAGVEQLPEQTRSMIMEAAGKAFDDLSAEFKAKVDGTSAGEVA